MKALWRAILLGCVLSLGVQPPIQAAEVCRITQLGRSPYALVARPGKLSEAISLLESGELVEAASCCVACLPDNGTKILVTERGWMSHTIRVLEGKFKGCVGDVVMEAVGDCR